MKVQAIIPAAGAGKRLNSPGPKALVPLKGKPLFVYACEVFESCSLISSVVVVGNEESIKDYESYARQYGLSKVSSVVIGGATRSASVSHGLKALDDDADMVLIHDGARPLVTAEIVERSISAAMKEKAVVVAVPVKPTIKRVNRDSLYVEETVDRKDLWEVQTPQVFRKDIILQAHSENKDAEATDDASLVEKLGVKVKAVKGSYQNIKITTQEDMVIAEQFLEM